MMSRIILSKTLSNIFHLQFTVVLLLIAFIGVGSNHALSQTRQITVQVECRAPDADFVIFVWGFNGWKLDKTFEPASPTKIEKNTYRTPMTKHGDRFVLEIPVPAGKVLNWGFLMGRKNAPKSKYFSQKSAFVDSTMAPLIVTEELIATDEELGYDKKAMLITLSLIGVFLLLGLLFIFSGLGKVFGFEPYGDYQLRVPMNNQLTYGLLITIAIIHVVVLIGSAGFIHYYRQIGEDWASGGPIMIFLVQFSLARENNAAVWYSSMVFFLAGLVALLAFWGVYNVRDNKAQIRTAWGWLILGGLFVGLSADELGSIHERLGMLQELNVTGDGAPGWIDLFAIPGGLVGLFMLWFFYQNFRRQKKSFFMLVLGVLALVSIFFQENFEVSSMRAATNPETWRRPIWQIILEEGSELLAVWCFLAAFVNLVYRLSLQKSLQNSLAAPEIVVPVKPAILIGLSYILVALSVFGTGIFSPLLEYGIEGGDNGMTSNWFPSMLAFIGAALSWLVWNAEKQNKKPAYLILALILLCLSMYYGAAFRFWFTGRNWGPISSIVVFESTLLLGIVYFAFKEVINYQRKWQIVFFSIWLVGLTVALFFPGKATGIRDLWPFGFILPVLIAEWMEKAE
ncbi:MAG: hypothetical protein KDE26_20280 [Bacteroidetes bacterium]|nr:hypothetical protein [Bacteroidota bacterium]